LFIYKEWGKRWFVLTTDELACYCDSKDELTNDVESALSIVPQTLVTDHDVAHGYAFRILVRIYVFCNVMIVSEFVFDVSRSETN